MDEPLFSVILLAIMFGLAIWLVLRREARSRRQTANDILQIRRTAPSSEPIYQVNYNYRRVEMDYQNAEGRWNEVVIREYEHHYGDWAHNGQRIKNMSQDELDGYFHSLTVNQWELTATPHPETARRRYFRRPRK